MTVLPGFRGWLGRTRYGELRRCEPGAGVSLPVAPVQKGAMLRVCFAGIAAVPNLGLVIRPAIVTLCALFDFMKADVHPKYQDSEIRCACGNVIKTRSTKPVVIIGICN